MVRFVDNSDGIKRALRRAVREAVQDAADMIVQEAIAKAPVDSGDLQRSISAGHMDDNEAFISVEFGAYSDHAAPVEYGTAGRGEPFNLSPDVDYEHWGVMPPGKQTFAPYPIEPKHGKYLSWVGPDGKRRFAKRVMHPGIEPQPYMRPAIDKVRNEHFRKLIMDAVAKNLARYRSNERE